MNSLILSTHGLSNKDKFGYWNDSICSIFSRLRSKALSKEAFSGHVEHSQLDFLGLSSVRSSPVVVERDKALISLSHDAHYKFSFQLEGEAMLEQDGRRAHLKAGQWSCYDTTRPYRLHLPRSYRQLVIQIPREHMDISTAQMSLLTACNNDGSGGLGHIICTLARTARHQADALPDSAFSPLAQTIVDLLDSNLQSQQAPVSNHKLSLLLHLKNHIRQHLKDPKLSVQQIAESFSLSPRHLHNLFSAEDETLSHYIRRLRLAKCKNDLLNPHKSQLTITEIALSWGFNNPTHFGRVFRETYGESPKYFRHQRGALKSETLQQ